MHCGGSWFWGSGQLAPLAHSYLAPKLISQRNWVGTGTGNGYGAHDGMALPSFSLTHTDLTLGPLAASQMPAAKPTMAAWP